MMRQKAADKLMKMAAQEPDDFETDDLLSAWQNHRNTPVAAPAVSAREALSTLAVAVQTKKFEKVTHDMEGMIETLHEEEKEEVHMKVECQDKLNENEKTLFHTNTVREDLEAKIKELAASVEKLAKEIESDKKATAETELNVKKASQTREEENKEFQTTVADQ